MEASTLISAIVPVYNGRRFVSDAVRSILSQTHEHVECIVVDDGSTDDSAAVAAAIDPAVRVIRTGNRGVSSARNTGLSAANGRFVAFLDADDLWESDRLAKGLEVLSQTRPPAAVLCSATVVGPTGEPEGVIRASAPLDPVQILLQDQGFPSSSSNLLVGRKTLAEVDGFDSDLSTAADWDLTLRLTERFTVDCLPDLLTVYRRRREGMGGNLDLMASDVRLAYRKAFARRSRSARFRRCAYARLFRMLAGSYLGDRAFGPALKYGAWSAAIDPRSVAAELIARSRSSGRARSEAPTP